MPQSKVPPAELKLTPDDVRLITLRAQGLAGPRARAGGVGAMLRRLGAVQLDTISVLARSHELVAYARLGAIPRARIERAYWHPRTASTFEYWAHAACVLPVEEWPYYSFRRRWFLAKGKRWHENHPGVTAEVLARLRSDGPLTATELGGAKNGGAWWDWSETKIAVEWLLDTGEVICARRTGWRRVYDLPERVLPAELLDAAYTDAECLIHLAGVTARALGVVTKADLSDYQRIANFGNGRNTAGLSADDAAIAAGLIPVEIDQGSRTAVRAWADPGAVATLTSADGKPLRAGRHRVTLLSPFDSLIWDRKRTLRTFAFEHSLEAYVPREKRVHGYFTMPLLAGGRLIGRVDPAREGRTLIARQLTLDAPRAAEPMACALAEAATWVGCDSIALGTVLPANTESRLRSALTAIGT
ncbi:MAG TPA: crosslink repair DNA glycosylase YcaQ family protein [Streptosporangiaceae bacterium]|nr:crosslink repair DNA glycosylase YcaQ family protein [Streptosporangiaceae bacterium]